MFYQLGAIIYFTYAQVYKGVLSSGEEVAIKKAQGRSYQGAAEFKNEIELLSRVHHRNLVCLMGFCFEEQMLVYEYIPNGTLQDSLLGKYLHFCLIILVGEVLWSTGVI